MAYENHIYILRVNFTIVAEKIGDRNPARHHKLDITDDVQTKTELP
jgi:hypothetical protein